MHNCMIGLACEQQGESNGQNGQNRGQNNKTRADVHGPVRGIIEVQYKQKN